MYGFEYGCEKLRAICNPQFFLPHKGGKAPGNWGCFEKPNCRGMEWMPLQFPSLIPYLQVQY